MKHAFSLVELSIVLVILGLLTGGILTGQSLIRAAELRSVTTEFQNYQTAVMTFRDKYFALPGDMTNAIDFWGAHSACGGSDTTGVCNGNGDGILEENAAANGQESDGYMIWRHLAKANLIEGDYTGLSAPANVREAIIGVNVPASKITSSGWSVNNTPSVTTHSTLFTGAFPNSLILGGHRPTAPSEEPNILAPEELWGIDTKIDDGKPGTGNLIAIGWDDCTNAPSNGNTTLSDKTNSEYLLTNTEKDCAIIFPNFF